MAQIKPVGNDSVPVVDQMNVYLLERKQLGIERYGQPLQPNNGRDAMIDAFEEAVDLCLYLGQFLIERDGKLPPT